MKQRTIYVMLMVFAVWAAAALVCTGIMFMRFVNSGMAISFINWELYGWQFTPIYYKVVMFGFFLYAIPMVFIFHDYCSSEDEESC